ncbi:Na(+)/H(+) antiporter subunit A [Oxobacter pfennigii]|uniref:Na(+)/H(+) antiporter subunit A n=1 Tax=Oxobacter pfennigii TaxID=36849 RepID=A0A0P9AB64_9CLOT|nr:proton-conducting transporter membrane subunit [Oxobacter pfennigii]KPU42300.1 Na(+)/H(+) antiporter subunit A [Oxobacter pfennigii]
MSIYFKVDKLGILFSLLVTILFILTFIYSLEYMKKEGNIKRFLFYLLLTEAVVLGIAFSGNLMTLYVFYEILALVTFPLIIHKGNGESKYNGKKYLFYSFGGAALILFGMIVLYSLTKSTEFAPSGIVNNLPSNNRELYIISYISMFLGFGVKAALVPFHSWLPAVMVAPIPASAFLDAAAVVKSGVFAIIRMSYFIFGAEVISDFSTNSIFYIFILLSIILGSFLALHQKNIQRRLAYSTISHLGYILLGIVMINEDALMGSLLHMVNHAFIKINLFLCTGAIIYMTNKTRTEEIRGIGKKMPVTMGCFTASAISLIGIPPANGFVSKWYLALGGLSLGRWIFPLILLLSALLTALYILPIITQAFFKKGNDAVIDIGEAPPMILLPIMIITAIIIVLGLFPNTLIEFIEKILLPLF